jgi:peptide/nickel transport system permease protein
LKRTLTLLVLSLLVFSALFAPWIAPYNPRELHLAEGLSPPSLTHLFGQDKLGRDLFSRILYGGRISLGIGVTVLTICLSIGVVIGAIAGLSGGKIDFFLMRLVDLFLAFPGILLAIAMAAVLGPSLFNIVIALSLLGWAGFARLVRGQILVVREEEYVLAARALGLSPSRIIQKHLLPNILSPVIVEATFGLAHIIVAEAALSFLGLGVQPPTPSWGGMLNDAKSFLLLAPHLVTIPGLVIMLAVMALTLLGDDLRDQLDVRSGDRT